MLKLNRVLTLALVALAVALFTGMPVLAADKAAGHEVTIIKAADGKLTVLGSDGKEHTHVLSKTAAVSCNGKACKVSDLKKGVKATVTVSGKGAAAEYTKIEAKTATTVKK